MWCQNGKLQPLTKVTFMNRLIWNLARLITLRGSPTLPSLVRIVSAVAPSRGGELYGSRAFYYYFCSLLYFLTLSVFGIEFTWFRSNELLPPISFLRLTNQYSAESVDKQRSYLLKRWIQQRTSGSTATSLHINVYRMCDALQCMSSRSHVYKMPYALRSWMHAHFSDNVIYI